MFCPYGFYYHLEKPCNCSSEAVQKYLNKIDLHIEITPVSFDQITSNRRNESSA